MEEIIENGEEQKRGNQLAAKSRVKMNKYALACALLASTNSILLGYGMFFSTYLCVSFLCLS